jgi:hypothetical protein
VAPWPAADLVSPRTTTQRVARRSETLTRSVVQRRSNIRTERDVRGFERSRPSSRTRVSLSFRLDVFAEVAVIALGQLPVPVTVLA